MVVPVVKWLRTTAWIIIPFVLAVGLLCKRIGKRPVVLVDHGWIMQFAETGCEMRLKLNDFCARDVAAEVRNLEARITAHFSPSGDCRDVVFAITGTNNIETDRSKSKADFLLTVNFSSGDSSQSWATVRSIDGKLMTGQNKPDEIAQRVCVLATQSITGESERAVR